MLAHTFVGVIFLILANAASADSASDQFYERRLEENRRYEKQLDDRRYEEKLYQQPAKQSAIKIACTVSAKNKDG